MRCRASVGGVLLQSANFATVQFCPGEIKFDTEKSKALSGDAIFLRWDDMGSNMVYDLYQWMPDASLEDGGSWKAIDRNLTTKFYTVYNLEKGTEYSFKVGAKQNIDDGRHLRFETRDTLTLRTLEEPYTFQATCRAEGTSLYVQWDAVDGHLHSAPLNRLLERRVNNHHRHLANAPSMRYKSK